MRHAAAWAATLSCVLLVRSSQAPACQYPPEPDPTPNCDLQAELVIGTDLVRAGEPFEVFVTVTNSSPENVPAPPPFQHDRLFDVSLTGCEDLDGDGLCDATCELGGEPVPSGAVAVVDAERRVLLDDAWAPPGDHPSVVTEVFTVVPEGGADSYLVQAELSVIYGSGTRAVTCSLSACVAGDPDPADDPVPMARFEDPLIMGEGGSVVPFSLRVDRHGYPTERPLTVRVIPENLFDPEDIFPLEPPGISTTGLTLVGEESHLVDFQCGLHYPCFVGAHNDYHVTIHDGPRLLWDSRWRGTPLGRATVAEAPLAHLELVGLEAESCASRLSDCTEGTLHLRLYARNPYHGVPMDDVVIELPLPAGLVVESTELHHHDNPLDAIDPSPAELAAEGEETIEPGLYRVTTARIDHRAVDAPPAAVFDDLFEVELRLALPAGGLGPVGELVFDGLRVEGTAIGERRSAVAAPLVVPVRAQPPPEGPPGDTESLRVFADGTLTWDGCEDGWAERFHLYRGQLSELPAGTAPPCLAGSLTADSHVDAQRPTGDDAWYYLVTGESCRGEGPTGTDSFGAPRAEVGGCP